MTVSVSDYTVNSPHEAAWLVYINGLEIPTLGVDVSYGVWQIPTASIKMVPHPMLQRLGAEDRLHVVIFYKDEFTQGEPSQFRLMGEFEIVGWTYQNSPSGRVLQLDCVNLAQIFTQLHCFYISSMDDIVAASALRSDPSSLAQSKVFYPASLFREGLVRVQSDQPSEKELADAAESERLKAEKEKVVRRLDYLLQPGTFDMGDLEEEKKTLYNQLDDLNDKLSNLGKEDSIVGEGDLIKRPIEFVLNVLKAIVSPVDFSNPDNPTVTTQNGHVPPGAAAVPGKNFFARWMLRTKFHHQWCALPMYEDPTPVPKRAGRAPGETVEPESENSGSLCFPLLKAVQDYQVMQVLQQQVGSGVGNSGSIWDLLRQVYSFMYMEVAMIPCPPCGVTEKKTGYIKGGKPGEGSVRGIRTYFVKPQCVFGLPPICNVIFPSMTQHFTFQETYITQPTRVYLGESFLSEYLDPSKALGSLPKQLLTTGFPPVVKHRMQELIGSATTNNKNFLVEPEELYKGPVTKRTNAPPWMHILQQGYKSQPATEGAALTDEQIVANLAAGNTDLSNVPTGLGALFDKYAEYEYYRSRFAERNGGVALAFNPYILPGFPSVVYDQKASGFDVMAYVMSVTHSMAADRSGAHMSTQVNLGFIRTFEEMAEGRETTKDLTQEATEYESDIYPPEPIPGVRDIFQTKESAEKFYEILLYGPDYKRAQYKSWRSGELTTKDEQDTATYKRVPSPEWAAAFEGYDAAMRAISRPVCTLRQYVEAYHQRPLEDLIKDGTVKGEYRSHYSAVNSKGGEGAVFWGRIYTNLSASPGYRIPAELSYVTKVVSKDATGADVPVYSAPESWRIADRGEIPDVRKNWDKILNEYRKILRGEEGKVAPQQ